ncbi:hypothetical protein B0G81_6156 [Paraburkholderia sp. BL6665CI2N2]|uniref:hypothetical protein n=1 Tax=Paraburkholderia sp. BL6665CI2N2 TaxID=1938806 RepID=UPI0010E92D7D|nr:hypothetical protein [Paraburkholderia sp. BL6665CI2N2]TDY25674.1 hypothetical protein B0G81_6156 [Paraburkholderia sp. BL6665CI2N2]
MIYPLCQLHRQRGAATTITLVWFSSRGDLMGHYRNRRATTLAATLGTVVVLALNLILLLQAARISPWPPFHAA